MMVQESGKPVIGAHYKHADNANSSVYCMYHICRVEKLGDTLDIYRHLRLHKHGRQNIVPVRIGMWIILLSSVILLSSRQWIQTNKCCSF